MSDAVQIALITGFCTILTAWLTIQAAKKPPTKVQRTHQRRATDVGAQDVASLQAKIANLEHTVIELQAQITVLRSLVRGAR